MVEGRHLFVVPYVQGEEEIGARVPASFLLAPLTVSARADCV